MALLQFGFPYVSSACSALLAQEKESGVKLFTSSEGKTMNEFITICVIEILILPWLNIIG